jgi:hypothetical protein
MSSARLAAFRTMCVTRFREFRREPEAIFWSFVFPILLFLAMGLAFRNRPIETLPVAVAAAPRSDSVMAALGASGRF